MDTIKLLFLRRETTFLYNTIHQILHILKNCYYLYIKLIFWEQKVLLDHIQEKNNFLSHGGTTLFQRFDFLINFFLKLTRTAWHWIPFRHYLLIRFLAWVWIRVQCWVWNVLCVQGDSRT